MKRILTSTLVFLTAAANLAANGGKITGTVAHPSVKRAPTIVYIEEIPGRTFTPPRTHPVVDQRGKAFIPPVLPVLVGTTVEFLNSDNFEHNVFSPDGEGYDLGTWGQGEKRTHTFTQPGVFAQLCKVHPEMIGYILVLKTPYFVQTDEEGRFSLEEVPEGTWQLKVWNERLRPKELKQSFPVKVVAGRAVEVKIGF